MAPVFSPPDGMGTVLALDYGGERIGVAVTDREQTHALAHGVVSAKPPDRAVREIQSIITSAGTERIVVGLPLTLAGTEGAQAAAVRTFAAALREATGLPVEFVDERYTSREAGEAARVKGTPADAEAARLILETWIGRQARTP